MWSRSDARTWDHSCDKGNDNTARSPGLRQRREAAVRFVNSTAACGARETFSGASLALALGWCLAGMIGRAGEIGVEAYACRRVDGSSPARGRPPVPHSTPEIAP